MKTDFVQNLTYLIKKNQITPAIFAESTALPLQLVESVLSGQQIPDLHFIIKTGSFFNCSADILISQNIEEKHKFFDTFKFRFLVLDVDGVMTDGGIIYTDHGDEIKKFHAKDGLAIIRLREAGYPVGFLSSGFSSNIIEKRAKVLGVQYVYTGTWKKWLVLEGWCKQLQIGPESVAYLGDDINDLQIIERVGFSACPSDASEIVKQNVNVVLKNSGGKGCVREFVDCYLNEFTKNPF